jgi:hypothetical protein
MDEVGPLLAQPKMASGCGRNNHTVDTCHFTTSPYSSNKTYSAYTAYTKLRRVYPTASFAPSAKFLADKSTKPTAPPTSTGSSQPNKVRSKGLKIPDSSWEE